jgi:hypothetical protein
LPALLALQACTVYRAYPNEARPKNKVALVECDPEGVSVHRLDRYQFSGGWSEFEVLPGKHELVAELYWTRLDARVELPPVTAKFEAKPGQKYFCVFDVDEQKKTWALSVVPVEQVSWKARTFHGARTWRTPKGECVIWDEKLKGCLGDPGAVPAEVSDEQPPETKTETETEPSSP